MLNKLCFEQIVFQTNCLHLLEQGIKDAGHLMELLGTLFCRNALKKNAADAAAEMGSGAGVLCNGTSPSSYDNFFTIHMAILTANLGKKLFVSQGCMLYCMLHDIFHVAAGSRTGIIEFAQRLDDQCNTEIFSICNWEVRVM